MSSIPWGVVAFTVAYLLAAAVGVAVTGNGEFVFYLGVMVVLVGCVVALHRQVGLSQGVLWCLTLWGALHMAGGLLPVPAAWPINGDQRVLYSLWLIPERLKYDQLVHAFGFGTTTVVCWEALRSAIAKRFPSSPPLAPTWGLMLLVGAAGMGFGALNEVIEFIAVLLIPSTNVGGYVNTGWDLVSNLVGCVVAAVCIRWRG